MGPTQDVPWVANWWSQAIVHALTYVTFALSLVHGLRVGSDTGSLWGLAFYAALRNGLTQDEIKEVLLQSAIYCGVPAVNSAFAVAQRVLDGHNQHPEAKGDVPE